MREVVDSANAACVSRFRHLELFLMALKRKFPPDESLDEAPVQDPKHQFTFENAVRLVMRGLSMQELVSNLEPFFRRVVREEVERVIRCYMPSSSRPTLNQIEASGSRGWQLHFRSKLPGTFFTGNLIKAEDNTAIKIVILAANSERMFTTGTLSSLKVEILVLNGDFGSDDQEDWTEEDFDASVICEREGKRPLIAGDLSVTLNNGVGYVGDITLTDNSSWTRSRTFKLGARVVHGTCNIERVREAVSGAFVVKDHRGELYKKHYPPSLGDEVWRLEKISKDGVFHKQLASSRIYTVQDFLRVLVSNPLSLRRILHRLSNKKWDAIVQHATTCTLDNRRYIYGQAGQQVGLLFDSIYKVVGATFDWYNVLSLDSLSSYQMSLVERVKQHAYQNLKDISEVVCPMVDIPSIALQELDVSYEGSSLDEQVPDFQVTDQDGTAPQMSMTCTPNSFSCILEDVPAEDVTSVQNNHPMQQNYFKENGLSNNYTDDGNKWMPGGPSAPVLVDGHFNGYDISQIQMSNSFASWEQVNGIFLASGDERGIGLISSLPDFDVHMTNGYKPNMGWYKLRAAFKSVIPFRQGLAARRARIPQVSY